MNFLLCMPWDNSDKYNIFLKINIQLDPGKEDKNNAHTNTKRAHLCKINNIKYVVQSSWPYRPKCFKLLYLSGTPEGI